MQGLADRVLCITFGSPPSSVCGLDWTKMQGVASKLRTSDLFWNFVLARVEEPVWSDGSGDVVYGPPEITLQDAMPAVIAHPPTNSNLKRSWLLGVQNIAASLKALIGFEDKIIQQLSKLPMDDGSWAGHCRCTFCTPITLSDICIVACPLL